MFLFFVRSNVIFIRNCFNRNNSQQQQEQQKEDEEKKRNREFSQLHLATLISDVRKGSLFERYETYFFITSLVVLRKQEKKNESKNNKRKI